MTLREFKRVLSGVGASKFGVWGENRDCYEAGLGEAAFVTWTPKGGWRVSLRRNEGSPRYVLELAYSAIDVLERLMIAVSKAEGKE